MRVLLVEDERDLANAIARGLRRDGLAVDVAYDGAEALEKAAVHPYEVVVLDRDLPAVHGDEVCRELVAGESDCRILMLTAAAAVDDRIEGLDLGADGPEQVALSIVAELLAVRTSSAPRHLREKEGVIHAG